MTGRVDDPAVLLDLGRAVLVGEVLAADGAGPVFAVARLGAGGLLRLGLGQAVRHFGLHRGGVERFRAEGLTRGFFGIDHEIVRVGAGFHRISVTVGFPNLKGACEGSAASQIDDLHFAGAGDRCRAADGRVSGVRGDRNILRTGDGQRAAESHAAVVGDLHIAGAVDICRAAAGRGAGVRGDRDILRTRDGQRTWHDHAGAFVGERHVAGAGNIRNAGDRRIVDVCGDRDILRTGDGQRTA